MGTAVKTKVLSQARETIAFFLLALAIGALGMRSLTSFHSKVESKVDDRALASSMVPISTKITRKNFSPVHAEIIELGCWNTHFADIRTSSQSARVRIHNCPGLRIDGPYTVEIEMGKRQLTIFENPSTKAVSSEYFALPLHENRLSLVRRNSRGQRQVATVNILRQ